MGEAKEIRQVTVREMAQAGAGSLVDVREAAEFAEIRAKGVRNLPLSWIRTASAAELAALRLTEPVFLICRSGQRSMAAAGLLQAAGYDDLRNVSGGTLGWVAAGLPTETGQAPEDRRRP